MKYAQGIIGLLVGTALGGSVVAATTEGTATGSADKDSIRAIVLEVIKEEPQAIMESVSSFQMKQREAKMQESSAALKDSAVKEAIFNDDTLAIAGNKNGKHVVAEFFDYDCPVCKMQFKIFADMIKKDPELKIVFHEYPIFGPVSEENSRIGLAVTKLYPEKYYTFHEKMMGGKGHETTNDRTYGILKEMGLDVEKVKATAKSDEIVKKLADTRALGQKLNIQGTPTIIVGDEVIPHAAQMNELEAKFSK